MSLVEEVLAKHVVCNCVDGPHCDFCDQIKFSPWPCESVRLATELQNAQAVVEAARPIVRAVFDPDGFVPLPLSQDLASALARYDEGRQE